MGDVKYQQLPTFNLKRGNAQNKHSLPTRRADSSHHGLGAGLVTNCAGCMDRDPLARANVRACGGCSGPRDGLSSPSMPLTRTASHGVGSSSQSGHGDLATVEVNVVVPHPNVVGVEVDDNTKFGNVTMTASPAAIS